jgi:hypothetical protein
MNWLINLLTKFGLLKDDLDNHLIRASMVIIYFFFGYQKWFDYEAQGLIPFFTHGPLIFWMYPVFGMQGATYFLGVSEWLFGALLFAGFLEQETGVTGCSRISSDLHNNRHDHPLHAGWLGRISRRISRDGRKRCIPHEGCRPACCLVLLLKQDVVRVSFSAKYSA